MNIVVSIPVYDGKVPAESVRCLLMEQSAAMACGDDFKVRFLPNCSHAAMGRNQLANDFMESDADRLIFLDADVTYEQGALVKLAHQPFDFVGGCYRFKLPNESYPIGWLPDPELIGLRANEHGLLEVKTLPGGFLSISRKVFETIKEKFPGREYEHFGKTAYCYFQMTFADGHLYGEDSHFCKEWREAGGKIFLDPEIELTHWDFMPVPFKGHIGNWLKGRKENHGTAHCN